MAIVQSSLVDIISSSFPSKTQYIKLKCPSKIH